MCAPTDDNVKCKHDHSDYPPALIQKLRMYFHNLPKLDQRYFVAPGVRCALESNEVFGMPESNEVASFSWFCSLWCSFEQGLYRRTAKIRKWMPFAKCDDCAIHRQKYAETKDPTRRRELMTLHREHLEPVKRERLSYIVRQRLAIMYPDRYLSLIIDGADSSSMQIPHLHAKSTTFYRQYDVVAAIQ